MAGVLYRRTQDAKMRRARIDLVRFQATLGELVTFAAGFC